MAIFTRRVLQRCLDENLVFVTTDQSRNWENHLNGLGDDYLAWEWEVVLLNAFAKFGKVLHEPPIAKYPLDLVFESSDRTVKFGADITTISDASLHKRNPIDKFRDELHLRVLRSGVDTGRFIARVDEEQPVPSRGSKRRRRLLLPPVEDFAAAIFGAEFDHFIQSVKTSPTEARNYQVVKSDPEVRVLIQYQPGRGAGAGVSSYAAYTTTTVRHKNPLYNGLKNKIDKMKNCGYDGLRGLIVCDGESRIFSEMPNWSSYTMQEVVLDFFSRNRTVDFILTIGIKSDTAASGNRTVRRFDPKLFVRDQTSNWIPALDNLLVKLISSLPAIHQTPMNAINRLKWDGAPFFGTPYLGGSMISRGKIQISSRELLDLLAGRLDYKLFAENHATTRGGENVFKLFRAQGRMITSARVRQTPDEDDDTIEFEFGEPDPAISRFTLLSR